MSKNEAIEMHKFGGSSLATAEHFRATQHLINEGNAAIVVSASAGITNKLQEQLTLASQHETFEEKFQSIKLFQQALIDELLVDVNVKQQLNAKLDEDFAAIASLLRATWLLGSYSKPIQDKVLGYGELWSAQILAALLNQSA